MYWKAGTTFLITLSVLMQIRFLVIQVTLSVIETLQSAFTICFFIFLFVNKKFANQVAWWLVFSEFFTLRLLSDFLTTRSKDYFNDNGFASNSFMGTIQLMYFLMSYPLVMNCKWNWVKFVVILTKSSLLRICIAYFNLKKDAQISALFDEIKPMKFPTIESVLVDYCLYTGLLMGNAVIIK